jgi:hypothetical protein
LIGRRLPPGRWPELPGDYVGPVKGYTGDVPAVFFLKPNARDPGVPPCARAIQHVVSPPHKFRECPDGSLEIRNSLGDMHNGVSDGWHGYLDAGHRWRKE